MRKRICRVLLMIGIGIFLIGWIPYPRFYKDGGTVELAALWYRYKHWHFLDNDIFAKYKNDPEYRQYYCDGYWDRVDFDFFPMNLKERGFFE